MKTTKKQMTVKEAIVFDIAQEIANFTLLGHPCVEPPKTPGVVKNKILGGLKKFFGN